MATITKRQRADGTIAYRVAIRIKRGGKIIHQEAQTFDQRKLAEAWGKRREIELQHPGALQKAAQRHTVADLIKWYLEEHRDDFGRSKIKTLELISRSPLGDELATGLTADRLIAHIQFRRKQGAGPSTALNDLVWVRVLLKAARPALGLPLDLPAVEDAVRYCRDQRMVGRPNQRSRRPTAAELKTLEKYFEGRPRSEIPMVDIMWFAIWSARRLDEITRLRWGDNDTRKHTGIVRDAKHPTRKEGNHRTFKYTPEAWEIVQRQPKGSEFIFPFNSHTLGTQFSNATKACGIEDLRFHDLRHEAVSRLFERRPKLSILEVQMVSLHESWTTLKRYTQLRPGDLKF